MMDVEREWIEHLLAQTEEEIHVKQLVKNMINSWKVVIFTNRHCPRSRGIKDHFTAIDVSFDGYDVEDLTSTDKIQKELNRIAGDPLMPKVFIEGKYFGTMEHVECALMNETLYQLSARGAFPH